MKTVFVPKEVYEGETRVAAIPATIKRLVQEGFSVQVESNAGMLAYFSDQQYIEAGAKIIDEAEYGFSSSSLILMVNPPLPEQAALASAGATFICFFEKQNSADILEILHANDAFVFSVNDVPRISRAQKIDALSSQANLAGYKAVLLAAVASPKIFPLMMTAAGTLRPARVVVLGAGVAGLQAIATAKRLGAVVEVSDVRPAVKEQVESLGATYIEVPSDQSMETEGGYAKEASADFLTKQAEITKKHVIEADVVITTALVRGKSAPLLITADTVSQMKPGSVIVDLAAVQGGNCELTKENQIVSESGVKIIGTANLPATLPVHASEVYARNILNIILDQLDSEKNFTWNREDEVVQSALHGMAPETSETDETSKVQADEAKLNGRDPDTDDEKPDESFPN